YVFFFQAEDGIRDLTVTGVQTCALPISSARQRSMRSTAFLLGAVERIERCLAEALLELHLVPSHRCAPPILLLYVHDLYHLLEEIGRASCRERLYVWVWEICVVRIVR